MHLVVAITPHGYGHAAQVSPVINQLQRQLVALRVTVLTTLPETFLRSRIEADFHYIHHSADFGLVMESSLQIDLTSSAERYKTFHADWDLQVENESRVLEKLQPDCVLADVPCLTLAAAARINLPVFALCSLNWADIYRHYFSERPEAEKILAEMTFAYQQADIFFTPEPHMPMSWLDNRQQVGPIARRGNHRREELLRRLDLSDGNRLVLVAPGGVATQLPTTHWPRGTGVSWLVADRFGSDHPDLHEINEVQMSFMDILASVDLLLGKCGYGSVAECVVNATPMLYIPRPDWPEEPCLIAWLEQHGAAMPVSMESIVSGNLLDAIDACVDLEVNSVEPTGARQVANGICKHLQLTLEQDVLP